MDQAINRTLIVLTLVMVSWSELSVAIAENTPSSGTLTLRDGSQVKGRFSPVDSGEVIAWQADQFVKPFDFLAGGVSAISFPPPEVRQEMQGAFAIETSSGDLLSGQIVDWTDEFLVLESPHFGTTRIESAAFQRLYRIDENSGFLFSGLAGMSDWEKIEGEWGSDGTELWAMKPDASLVGDFDIPDKAVVEFSISWTETPNFSFAIGVDPTGNDGKKNSWSFDTWNSTLALVRENDATASVEPIAKLDQSLKQIRLIAYLDRVQNSIQVYQSDGKFVTQVSFPSTSPQGKGDAIETTSTGIAFDNHSGQTRLEHLRISRWNGTLPLGTAVEDSRYELLNGKLLTGHVISYDRPTQTVTIRNNSETTTFPLDQLKSADTAVASSRQSRLTTVVLQDQTRVSGKIIGVGERALILEHPHLQDTLSVSLPHIRSVNLRNLPETDLPKSSSGKQGALVLEGLSIKGNLVPGEVTEGASCLIWKPQFSHTASPLIETASGRIIYKELVPIPALPEKVDPLQNNPFGGFGNLFLNNLKKAKPKTTTETEPHDLHLLSGDVLPCEVQSITEEGVQIRSVASKIDVIPHHKIKAVVLDRRSRSLKLDEKKKERLLILPRNQTGSPPTHLLCSSKGDFLRCRLNSLAGDQLHIEVHLRDMRIPLDRISHLIWLHPENLSQKKTDEEPTQTETTTVKVAQEPPAEPVGLHEVQVILSGQNRSTFHPTLVDTEFLQGQSDVIGECSFRLSLVEQILFGQAINRAARELPYHQWVLSPAPRPLYELTSEGGTPDDGLASVLVGKPAPDFRLKLLDGGSFTLSEAKGKIIVLDFWTTWCGPCMLTMPMMEVAMEKFDPDQVQLISVNMEERPEHVKEVLERHQRKTTVALDIDGVVAGRYQVESIPQLVVVDAEGKVARLYIGGGQGVVDQFSEAMLELLETPDEEPVSPAE